MLASNDYVDNISSVNDLLPSFRNSIVSIKISIIMSLCIGWISMYNSNMIFIIFNGVILHNQNYV